MKKPLLFKLRDSILSSNGFFIRETGLETGTADADRRTPAVDVLVARTISVKIVILL